MRKIQNWREHGVIFSQGKQIEPQVSIHGLATLRGAKPCAAVASKISQSIDEIASIQKISCSVQFKPCTFYAYDEKNEPY